MKKIYFSPSMKVREIESEELLAASPGALTEGDDGTETEDDVDSDNPGSGSLTTGEVLGKQDAWSAWDEEE